jgi:hypothetical protein
MNNRGAIMRTAIVPGEISRSRPVSRRSEGRGRADWFAYKGRPAAKPKTPPPPPKEEPAPEAPKPVQPGKEAGAS